MFTCWMAFTDSETSHPDWLWWRRLPAADLHQNHAGQTNTFPWGHPETQSPGQSHIQGQRPTRVIKLNLKYLILIVSVKLWMFFEVYSRWLWENFSIGLTYIFIIDFVWFRVLVLEISSPCLKLSSWTRLSVGICNAACTIWCLRGLCWNAA